MTEEPAAELNVKQSLIRALISSGDLRALQVGGRGVWRIGRQDIEDYIAEASSWWQVGGKFACPNRALRSVRSLILKLRSGLAPERG